MMSPLRSNVEPDSRLGQEAAVGRALAKRCKAARQQGPRTASARPGSARQAFGAVLGTGQKHVGSGIRAAVRATSAPTPGRRRVQQNDGGSSYSIRRRDATRGAAPTEEPGRQASTKAPGAQHGVCSAACALARKSIVFHKLGELCHERIDQQPRRCLDARLRDGGQSAQQHRQIEEEHGIVAPVSPAAGEVGARRRHTAGTANRRVAQVDCPPGAFASRFRAIRHASGRQAPVQEIAGDLGIDVTAPGADATRPRRRSVCRRIAVQAHAAASRRQPRGGDARVAGN